MLSECREGTQSKLKRESIGESIADTESDTLLQNTFASPILTTLLLGFTLLLSSFEEQKGIDEVINALRSGSSSQLSVYFDDNVELTLPDKSDSYSKAQAQLICFLL